MAHVNVKIRMDENDKKAVEGLFSKLGLTMDEAFNMFAKQAIKEQAIPFRFSENENIEYMDKNTLNELYDKSTEKYGKAYEKLSKYGFQGLQRYKLINMNERSYMLKNINDHIAK